MSDELYTLAYLTNHSKINQILQGVIGVFEKAFLGRIRGYYLQGSFGSQSAVTNSDLDMYVIFKERFSSSVEAMTAMALVRSCAQISPVLLEIKPGAELDLFRAENAGITLNFKYSTQFLYGEDIRDRIPTPTSDDWVRWVMKAPQAALMITRSTEVLVFPLSQPDAQAEFYGYDRQTIPGADWIERPSTKWLIATVGWIATALVARCTKQYVGGKREVVELYKTRINDQWTDLVEQVYEQCRNHWSYLIPDGETDRQRLRSLCQAALEFSNYYLSVYRDFVLHELNEGTSKHQLLAIKNLARVIYPGDQEIVDALERLGRSSNEELRKAACTTQEQIKQALGTE